MNDVLTLVDLGDATTETRDKGPEVRPDNDVELGFN